MQLLLILASMIWGINIVVMKVIMESLPMYLVAGVRVICSAIIVGVLLMIKKSFKKLSLRQLGVVLLISFFNVSLNFYLSFTGIHLLKGSSTALINALNPVITCVFSCVILKQSFCRKTWIGVFLSFLGFMLSIRFDLSQLTTGTWFLLASLASYSFSTILVKKKGEDIPSLVISFYSLLFGAIQLLILSYFKEGLPIGLFVSLSLQDILLFLGFSICGFAFIQSIHLLAVDKIGPMSTSFYLNLNPIFTYLASIIFLKESIDMFQIIGFCIILCSLFIAREKREL
ncbi:MAG: DMT family transporter [Coprobacillaceae bacterium]